PRARLLRRPRLARRGRPPHVRDLAGSARELAGGAVADVDDLGLQGVDRWRERMGEPFDDGAVVETDPSIEGQAYVGLDLAALHLDAIGFERALDVVQGLRLARAAALPAPP